MHARICVAARLQLLEPVEREEHLMTETLRNEQRSVFNNPTAKALRIDGYTADDLLQLVCYALRACVVLHCSALRAWANVHVNPHAFARPRVRARARYPPAAAAGPRGGDQDAGRTGGARQGYGACQHA
ncbi:hypothetical protein EON67_01560 [archaeon]|nr:MAG: hypothetical protein EON67_01560 [archaeon]